MTYSPFSPFASTTAKAALAAAMTLFAVSASQAAPINLKPVSVDPIVQNTASSLTGKQRLKRLMRPHIKLGNPITQSVRNATGDPNITVIDRRSGFGNTYTCTFTNLRKNQRVLLCD